MFAPRRDAHLRKERAERDWTLQASNGITLDRGPLPAQYPALTREYLRAFLDSDQEFAVVDVDAATMAQTIGTLGFGAEVYVEIRDEKTVLRRKEQRRSNAQAR
jgi:hypothetical protein